MRKKFIYFSILIHISAILIFTYLENKNNITKVDNYIVEIENNTKAVKESKNTISKLNEKNRFIKNILFRKLSKLDLLKIVNELNTNNRQKLTSRLKISDSKLFDEQIESFFGEDGNQNWNFYRAIYEKIDQHLIFDSILAQFKHFGIVRTEFYVRPNGIIDKNSITLISDNPILKIHVLWALKKALQFRLEKNKYSENEGPLLIQAQFTFLYSNPKLNFVKQNNFGTAKFNFVRATLEKPIPDELSEHLMSGGLTPNISLMYERWQKYNKKKDWQKFQFDPFMKYKNDPNYN